MDQQEELEAKRREAREEILAMKDAIPTARILNFFGGAFPRQRTGYWLANFIILNLIAVMPWGLIGFLRNELVPNRYLWIPGMIAIMEGFISVSLAHVITRMIFDDMAARIITRVSTLDDLERLLQWLKASWHKQNIFLPVLLWIILWLSLGPVGFSIAFHRFVGIGFLLTSVIVGAYAGLGFYTMIWITWLALSLRNYHYELNAFSPVDSEIINNITHIFTKCIYILAAYFACMTLLNTSNVMDNRIRILFSIPFLGISWVSIIIQYLITRSTIGAIVDQVRWKTLNRIQEKINAIESTGDLSDKETSERLFRLADTHQRILSSKTNSFDFKSVATLFSQLMLPLLGLLLGNLDKILTLLP